MSRWLLAVVVLAPTAACVTMSPQRQTLTVATAPALAVDDLPARSELPQDEVVEFDDWRFDLGNVVDEASLRLHAWADESRSVAPDLSILTTQPVEGVRSSGYGWRDDPFRHTQRFHSGADFPSKLGTPIAAAGNGIVTFAGRASGYGNMVLIDHGGGVTTLYGHLRRIEVDRGSNIAAGDRIGQVGRTGRATGPHLHFEVRIDGRPIDPVRAMAVVDGKTLSTSDRTLASIAPNADARVRAESSRRSRRKSAGHTAHRHSKRPQALW